MINKKPLELFTTFENGKFFKPRYADYSFGNIAPTIEYLLTGKKTGNLLPKDCFKNNTYPKPKKIVLILLDSFGFKSWERYRKKIKILDKIINKGLLTPLSALFPPTTASSVTSLCLGNLPSANALFAWNLYIERYGEVIQPLLFSSLGIKSPDACLEQGYDPRYLISPYKTIYQRLAKHNIKSYSFISQKYAKSVYNQIVYKEAEAVPFRTVGEGLTHLKDSLKNEERSYSVFYWDHLDSIGHTYGPHSVEYEVEAANFWLTFEFVFSDLTTDKDTLFLFTADHGQSELKKMHYLNLEIPGIEGWLKRGKNDEIIIPYGEPRAVFLQVKESKIQPMIQLLKERLKGSVAVYTPKQILDLGLFGPPPYNREFIKRLGQVVILPSEGQCIGWFIDENTKLKKGYHGGLSEEEALTEMVVLI